MPASASKSALLLSPCLRWAGGQGREYRDELANTEKRDKGTAFHAWMDAHFSGSVLPPGHRFGMDTEVLGWRERAVAWSREVLRPRCETIDSEVYVATNFSTGEVHSDPAVRDRNYPDLAGFLPGTADLVCVLRTGHLLVADWKTGGSAGADKQLLTLAVGLQKLYPKPDGSLRDVLLSVLLCGTQAGEAGVLPHEWPVTQADLQAHADAMAFQLADVGVRNDAVPGVHCSQLYCPHLAYCPGIAGIVDGLARGRGGLLPVSALTQKYELTDELTSDEHAGWVGAMLAASKRQASYYDQALRKYVESGGRVVSGDFEWKQTNSGMRWVKRSN